MKKLFGTLFLVFGTAFILLWLNRDILLKKTAETFLNQAFAENLAAPVDIQNLSLNKTLHFEIGKIQTTLKTPEGFLPLEIGPIHLEHSLYSILTKRLPLAFVFKGLKPLGSASKGIRGKMVFHLFGHQEILFQIQILELFLHELTALDAKNLRGISGTLTGEMTYRLDENQNQSLHLQITSPQPGGNLQAYLFDLLTPYLPPSAYKIAIEQIKETGLVHYDEASLSLSQEEPNRLKALIKILVPDYNLNLNLNLEIRVDGQNTLLQIAQVLGMIRGT